MRAQAQGKLWGDMENTHLKREKSDPQVPHLPCEKVAPFDDPKREKVSNSRRKS